MTVSGNEGPHLTPWARWAIDLLVADRDAEARTPLRRFPLAAPADGPPGPALYLKDESRRPTGSLKHGPARELLLTALRAGEIDRSTPLFEATSGNMAVAQAHFARLLGLPFTAVVPERASAAKRRRIEEHGGRCHPADPPLAVYEKADQLARAAGGHYLDHLRRVGAALDAANAAQAAERDSGLAGEILRDLDEAGLPAPAWIVVGVGSGATSRAIGRRLRARSLPTRLAVVDPENSSYFPGWAGGVLDYSTGMPSRIEGIGRPRMEPAFDPEVVDLVIPVPDAASVAAMRHLHAVTGLRAGPSSGACLWGAFHLVDRMRRDGGGDAGPVVALVGDAGEPYRDTYYDDAWTEARGWRLADPLARAEPFTRGDGWRPATPPQR
ncbi:pyridoxal-phosphate dependent enzyme [Streptomyces sp. 3MP-14]|uniref:Pyridoxal-phosphate dependent enzyme n=1 Tax=Streptomyces mimosae TaxID=2586635 RepID=A0A5N6A9J9_9ACTN|nr:MULTISPECIES: pyridoxal-phosphate dependent enzyme [Streptomyces]KAB8164683.1 pyridoxal-phosphate dependent enzyme [Streptomyces mimosae]KAB8175599.1 pyridoxal-phosphate dependent enzyme [Streptomyces sp. 3MP-14]